MEQQTSDTLRLISTLPEEAITELIQLAGNFLCSDFSMDKLKIAVNKTLKDLTQIEGINATTKELEKYLEAIVWFIESHYSKPYEVSQGELAKIGIGFYLEYRYSR